MNTFGRIFRLTDFGESHGKAIGGIVDGCPSGVKIDIDFIQQELDRRIPGNDPRSTQRRENDRVEFLSGIVDGKTIGSPIGFLIKNEDIVINHQDEKIMRPSHASYTYREKYGAISHRECGRASARQNACRVVAGAIAKLILKPYHIEIETAIDSMGKTEKENDSFGAKINGVIKNLPAGLGEPVYDKFHARLGYAMLSINACKGFSIGKGFEATEMSGTQYRDIQNSDFSFRSNHDGGVQGGITNGEEVYFSLAFKPIPTARFPVETIDFDGNKVVWQGNDRNDLSVVPRVLPVIEAMAAIVTVDFLFIAKGGHYE